MCLAGFKTVIIFAPHSKDFDRTGKKEIKMELLFSELNTHERCSLGW
jgi:hypothetical protein